MSYAQLQERGFEIIGGDSAETLAGTPYDDRLAGGKGDDVLAGGAGDDAYVFNPGDGYDAIMDTAGVNNIYLGAGFA
ncbi:MAG: hypothetical protein LBJ59_04980, partial [Zoogloeaceae bacterium]|nr:hypothetical protein [Zoogloeaceae bacterium]